MLLPFLFLFIVTFSGFTEAHRKGKSYRRHLHKTYLKHKDVSRGSHTINRKCYDGKNCYHKSKGRIEEGALQRSLQNVFDHYETLRHILTNHKRKKIQGLLPLLNPSPENKGNLSAFTASEYINGNPTVSSSHQVTPNHMLPNQNLVHRAHEHSYIKPTEPSRLFSYSDHNRPVTIKPALKNNSEAFLNTSTCLSYASNDFDRPPECTNRSIDDNKAETTAKPPAPPKTTKQVMPLKTTSEPETTMVKPMVEIATTMVTPVDQKAVQETTTQAPVAASASNNDSSMETTVAPTKMEHVSSKSPLDERDDWVNAASDLENTTKVETAKKDQPSTEASGEQKDEFEPCAKDSATIRSLSSAVSDTLSSTDLMTLCSHFNREIPEIIDQIMDKERQIQKPPSSPQTSSFQSGILNYMSSKREKHKSKKDATKKRLIRKKAFVTRSEVPHLLLK